MPAAVDPFQPMSMPLMITAVVAVVLLAIHAGIALVAVRGFAGDDGDPRGPGKRFFLQVALVFNALNLAVVPATLVLLAPAGLTLRSLAAAELSLACLLASVVWTWRELARPTRGSGSRFPHLVGAFLLFCVTLVTARLVHRDEVTQAYHLANPPKAVAVVQSTPVPPPAVVIPTPVPTPTVAESDPLVLKGEKVFKTVCIVCHAVDKRLVGPPIQEIATLYKGNPKGIAAWAKAPGKKRPDYPPMIPVPLPEDDLIAAGAYMLKIGAK